MSEDTLGASASGPGSREPDPQAVPAASGFDPSRGDRLQRLIDAKRAETAQVLSIIPTGHKCGIINVTEQQWDEGEAVHQEVKDALAALVPTEQDAINLMADCYQRLRDLGWREAMYCPKDGSEFDAIEAGSTGIHRAHYSGEWPTGSWWIADAGDLWPSHPILYRPSEAELAAAEGRIKRFRALRDSDGPRMAETNEDSARGEAGPARAEGIAQTNPA